MRLARITWKTHGMASEEEMRERADFKAWLEAQGASYRWWMLDVTVRW